MTRESIYGFIAAEKTTYPIRLLCRVLQVIPEGAGPGQPPVSLVILLLGGSAPARGRVEVGGGVEDRPEGDRGAAGGP